MTAPDLKPCPFCGEADQETLMIEHLEGTILHPAYRVRCDNCGASTGYSDRGDHIAAWNTRATPLAEALAVQDAARVLLDWWNSDEVSDARVIVAVSTALKANEGHTWEQFDAALRAIGEGK